MNKKEISNKQYLAVVNQAYISLIHDNSFNGDLSAKDYYLRRKAQEAKHASDILLKELGLSVEKEKPVEDIKSEAKVQKPKPKTDPYPAKAAELFGKYEWTKKGASYTELAEYLKKSGITSNRIISCLFRAAKENGIIIQPKIHGKYYDKNNLPPF